MNMTFRAGILALAIVCALSVRALAQDTAQPPAKTGQQAGRKTPRRPAKPTGQPSGNPSPQAPAQPGGQTPPPTPGQASGGTAASKNATFSVVPSPVLFGTHDIGTKSFPYTVTITNTSDSSQKIAVSVDQPDYVIETNDCKSDLEAKKSCAIAVSFSPQAEGDRSGHLQINSQSVADVQGGGQLPALGVSSTHLLFSPQAVSTTSTPQTVTLTNNSSTAITITDIAATGDFIRNMPPPSAGAKAFLPHTLAKQESFAVTVSFSPKTEGDASGMLTISTSSSSPQVVYLTASTSDALMWLCSASSSAEVWL